MKFKRIILYLITCVLSMLYFSSCTVSDLKNDQEIHWSVELEYEIKLSYAQKYLHISDESQFNISDVSMTYYGTYNGYEAVLNTGIGSTVITPKEVGGHLFKFSTSNIILMYRNGEFIEFDVAFKEGKITQEDIDRLFTIYSDKKRTANLQ